MKRKFLNIVKLIGLVVVLNTLCGQYSYAAAEKEAFSGKHESMELASRILMSEIEGRGHDIFEDILSEKYDSITEETSAIVKKAKEIDELFFPIDPDLQSWYRRSQAFDPEIL